MIPIFVRTLALTLALTLTLSLSLALTPVHLVGVGVTCLEVLILEFRRKGKRSSAG